MLKEMCSKLKKIDLLPSYGGGIAHMMASSWQWHN